MLSHAALLCLGLLSAVRALGPLDVPFEVATSLSFLRCLDIDSNPRKQLQPHHQTQQQQALTPLSGKLDPPKPNLPPQFTSFARKTSGFLMRPNQNITLWYDAETEQSREDSIEDMGPWFTSCRLNTSLVSNSTNMAYVSNGVCRPINGNFDNFWSFLRVAHYIGQNTIDDVVCDTWFYQTPDLRVNLTLYNNGDRPVRLFQQVFAAIPPSPPKSNDIIYDFVTITPGKPDPSIVAFPEACTTTPPVCESTQGIQSMLFYLAHPPDSYNITDQDAADPVGDTAFTCSDVISNHTEFDHYGVVSVYNVTVDTRWGQYALCNGYSPPICLAQQNTFVGRESSFGCAHNGGQCDSDEPDPEFGFWYSFPSAGKCAQGVPVGQGCTWGNEQRIKTVSFDCLLKDRGLLNACITDGGMPFPQATKVFLDAFATEDASQGGCPDVPPSL